MNNINEQVSWILVQCGFLESISVIFASFKEITFLILKVLVSHLRSLTVTTVSLAIYLFLHTGVKSGLLMFGNRVV